MIKLVFVMNYEGELLYNLNTVITLGLMRPSQRRIFFYRNVIPVELQGLYFCSVSQFSIVFLFLLIIFVTSYSYFWNIITLMVYKGV